MVLFFTLLSLVLAAISCVFVAACVLKNKPHVVSHMENVADSFDGVHKVAHDNASKTVECSMSGATNTLSSFGISDLNMDNFYNSLNKKKEQQ